MAQTHGQDLLSFDRILNLRDVGRSINTILGSRVLQEGRLFRSGVLDDATLDDRTQLLSSCGVKTVIDLRSKTEHINAAKKHSDMAILAQSAAVPSSNHALATPLRIPSVHYVDISLNGPAFERALFWQLGWADMARLLWLLALGYRIEAIAIVGREVMRPRGLAGLGIDTVEYSHDEIRQIFEVLANGDSYPVLIHCTQGKDRTGLVVLLVLMLCGVEAGAIQQDYALSERELEPERQERLKEIASIGLDESFAGCPADFVETVTRHIDEQHDGIESYLQEINVPETVQEKVQQLLKWPSDKPSSGDAS